MLRSESPITDMSVCMNYDVSASYPGLALKSICNTILFLYLGIKTIGCPKANFLALHPPNSEIKVLRFSNYENNNFIIKCE